VSSSNFISVINIPFAFSANESLTLLSRKASEWSRRNVSSFTELNCRWQTLSIDSKFRWKMPRERLLLAIFWHPVIKGRPEVYPFSRTLSNASIKWKKIAWTSGALSRRTHCSGSPVWIYYLIGFSREILQDHAQLPHTERGVTAELLPYAIRKGY
jgi:hypothetical protein